MKKKKKFRKPLPDLQAEKKNRINAALLSKVLVWVIICFGIFLRLRQYLFDRSLWFDELILVNYVIKNSFFEFFKPQVNTPTAPLGFLLLQKIVTQVFGSSDYALRIIPLLTGIGSIFVFYKIAKYYVGKIAAPIALALFVVSDRLIYYSSEAKQYSSDVLITLILYLSAIRFQKRYQKVSNVFLFALAGALSVWLSHSAVFILASIGIFLFVSSIYEKNMQKFVKIMIISLFWLVSFTAFYFVSAKSLAGSKDLLGYWDYAFMPGFDLSFINIEWLKKAFVGMFRDPLVLFPLWFSIPAFFAGLGAVLYRSRNNFFILVMPIFFVLIASSFHKYPFIERLLLFIVPVFLLFITAAIWQIGFRIHKNMKILGVLLLGIILFNPLKIAGTHVLHPRTREEMKSVLQYIKDNKKEGDKIYVYHGARDAFDYYAPKYGLDEENSIYGVSSRENWDKYAEDLNRLKGQKRVWVVFSHVCFWVRGDEQQFFISYLDRIGSRMFSLSIPETIMKERIIKFPGAVVYLYDFENKY
ncbi:MAG: hypothetical protein COS99_03800 [Candidatus Omnitrophica bacterium CG07_land_8_20_14_0_80_42_15]|uniref:Glycosyltransferase RgtA/B/C/D-like domain-containing protein n=1 Tax=Candidatus Aquitaenariimonas noxiae TaxID=1974741 RepID=A0A2J0KWR1_9BACT|nr:MAG: hypothetical protein COS99_03800 [Candidatus Omnitrophica bacterium CG07_land_8_20_14_0_80_42_15]